MSEIPIMVMPWHRPDPCRPSKMQTDAAFKSSYLDYLSSLNLESPPLNVCMTCIMCTIGNSSNNVDMMVDLIQQGMRISLVPLALGVRQDQINTIANLRTANTTYNQTRNRVYPLGIAVQTKGPGLRIGGLYKDLPVDLALHHKVTLSTDKAWRTKGTEHYLYIGFPEMSQVLAEGDVLLIGNGLVILQVDVIDKSEVVCTVMGAGTVHSFMSVSVPDVPLRLPPLTAEDVDDLKMAAQLGVDIVVASRTQTVSHLKEVRNILANEDNGSAIKVWAQIDTKQGLDNLDTIIEEADAILLSRVSLTQDMSADKLFLAQKIVVATCNKVGIPVFVSSHFLPSMQVELTPSLAELSDVATAILDGADGILLRNTTAIGRHPELTVRTLSGLCLEAEAAVWHHQTFAYLNSNSPPPIDPTHAIAISAVEASLKSSAAAILLATTSGRSAQLVARYRPRCPIIAVTRYGQVARQLNTWRAIIPLHYVDPPLPDWTREVDVRLQFGIEYAKQQGIVNPGDCLVLMNGWRQGAGFTNTIRIVYASESFPWVYPHRLPATIPSDKAVTESEKNLSPKATLATIQSPNSETTVVIPVTAASSSSKSGIAKVQLFRSVKPQIASEIKSMESDFNTLVSTKSKELQERTLDEAYRETKSEMMSKDHLDKEEETPTLNIDPEVVSSKTSTKTLSKTSQEEVVNTQNLEAE